MNPEFYNNIDIADPHSFANPKVAKVQHLDLDIEVSFEKKLIKGKATYKITAVPGAKEIILDIRHLVIKNIYLDGAQKISFTIGKDEPFLGQALTIPITLQTQKITIWYETTEKADALQWLNPEQTAGKQHHFLFTQSQAILARTWLPCQDSPGIRFTYEARVQVPPPYLALMSAENPQDKNKDGRYTFRMDQPIPSYLMALAIGDLDFKPLSANTGIYAEPAQLAAAAFEFAELPNMLAAAENLYGPYLWERYDLLVLPPSFPFGGMENPRLTFVTPTIITGDRSLTSLVAHELAHSWSGNLVTNATWNDFWLNEGFTVYFERRIMEALYGKPYADMLKVLGYQDLQQTLEQIGRHSPDTHLKLDLENRDPDEGLTEIAYEKGNYFLLTLEQAVGREAFDAFIRQYFKAFAFASMDTETFLAYLKENLLSRIPDSEAKPVPEEWIYKTGIPAGGPELQSARFKQVKLQAQAWQSGAPAAALETADWTTHEWLYFLHAIQAGLSNPKMQELENIFKLTQSGNSEILVLWLAQAIRHQYEHAFPALENFMMRIGRRKFLLPLYKELAQLNMEKARKIYYQARPNYHAVATSSLDELLK